ncbi:MAG: hypothetical protein ACRDGM_14955, partial [bacterium]
MARTDPTSTVPVLALAVSAQNAKAAAPATPFCKPTCMNRLLAQTRPRLLAQTRPDGYFAIRTFHRNRKGKKDPRFLFKCGCCDRELEVYYGEDSLE